jgi:WD40 repeat protein
LPFHGESHTEILRQVTDRDPTSPSTIIHRIDRDLETLCLRCLEKDPARRLTSAGELAEELKRWQRGEPVRARRITRMERLTKWTRRHPFRAATTVAFMMVLLGAASAIMWQWRRATTNEQRAIANADAERRIAKVERSTAYSATLSQALAAREHHDFGQARRLLDSIDPGLRGFDWRLLKGLCRGDEVQSFRLGEGTGSEPQCLALISGKEQLALISADGRLHVRDILGMELRPPRALPDGIGEQHRCYGLTFSPDGKRFAYARGDVLRVLDTNTFAILHEETSRLPQFDWLDNNRLLFGFNGSVARPPYPKPGAWILNFHGVQSAGQEIPRTSFPHMCAPLAVSPDRRFFVLHRVEAYPTSWARTLHAYRTDGDFAVIPEPLYKLPGVEYPGDITFSRTGRYLALSAGAPLYRNARVVEIASGHILFDNEFRFPIHSLAFDPQERRLGLVGDDSVVRVYDFTRGDPEDKNANTYDDAVELARCQQVDGRGAHVPPRDLVTRSAQDGRARFFLGHESRVSSVLFDSAGSLITASGDGTIRQWPDGIPRPAIRLGYMQTSYGLRQPGASADGRNVLYFADTAHLLDVARSATRNHNVIQFTGHRHSSIAVLRDGRPVTFGHEYRQIVLWSNDAGQLKEQKRIPVNPGFDHDNRIRNGVLSRDEKRLAGALRGRLFCVDLDKETIAWSGDLGKRISTFANHDLSPDGEWIATSDFGPRVTIHRFAEPDKTVTHLTGENRAYDTAVAFGRDGHRLYTGNEDGRIRVWDTATWEEIPELGWLAHRSAVTAIAVSHDTTLIATSGDDTLKLFPIDPEPGEPHRRERLSFHLDQPANWIQFASDENGQDRALLHSAPGRTLEIWETDRETDPPEPSLEDPNSLPFPLSQHTAVLLSSGKVLVVGGESNTSNTQNVALSECHLYDPVTGIWSTTGSLRSPRGASFS